jgi:ubiquinone/menaquinone biosynthesis C-methylase UbiE
MTEAWNPQTAYQDARVSSTYDSARFRSLTGRLGNQKEIRAFSNALNLIPQVGTAVDVACGTGRMTQVLLERGLRVTGVDVSQEMLNEAEAKLRCHADRLSLVRAALPALPFESNSVDLVTCIRLFGHYPSATRIPMLQELARITTQWVVVQFFYETPLTRLKRRIKHLFGVYKGVQHPLNENVLAHDLSAAGLREHARFFCRRYYSEEVFLLASKQSS